MRKVLLVGAGFIADVHAEVLKGLATATAWGVTDINVESARRLATRWSIPHVFPTLDSAIASGEFDCAHVLTPPDRHFDVGAQLLRAGIPVLMEKPLATTSQDCEALVQVADERGALLAVNHNLLYHPAFQRLESTLASGALGKIRSIEYTYAVPLRQLAARQFGHWMFRKPINLLLEQAVHPFSQIVAILGPIDGLTAESDACSEISPGHFIYPSVAMALHRGPVRIRLNFSVGRSFPVWQMRVECTDGIAVADMANNRTAFYTRTRWFEPVDQFLSAAKMASNIIVDGASNFANFALSTVRLLPRSDPFYRGMFGSIVAFQNALQSGAAPRTDGRFGSHLISLCEKVSDSVPFATNEAPKSRQQGPFDIAVIGGTGYIGSHVVEQLLARGRRLGVLARNSRNLPGLFYDDRIVIIEGDARVKADVERAIGSARLVVNLAHGGGGGSYEELRAAMALSAENVALVCLDRKVERLIHIGSIASLYLGDASEIVTAMTPADSMPGLRADYARAKVETDALLLAMASANGLPVHILRPGVVVGRGGIPLHGALGFFNNDQHCLGWSRGETPLPFVLVEDTADAIIRALFATSHLGRTYNVVGDVRLTAREYFAELSRSLERPLKFHPQSPTGLWLKEMGKWVVKRAIGRHATRPTLRDFRSRTLVAQFDCGDIKNDLGWSPETDATSFVRKGIEIYAEKSI